MTQPIIELIQNILETHHTYLKSEMPRLAGELQSLADEKPEREDLAMAFSEIKADLDAHMMKEEQILFPTLHNRALGAPSTHGCGIEGPMGQMEYEHRMAEQMLANLEELGTQLAQGDAALPLDTVVALERFQSDLKEHIRKEENELFSAARSGFPAQG